MAILRVKVQGGSDFGGYLSVNGGKEIMLYNGIVYKIPTGNVRFDYFSRSAIERKTGKLNAAVNGGSMLGSAIAANNMGQEFSVNHQVNENDIIEFSAFVRGNRDVYAAPVLDTTYSTPQEIESLIEENKKNIAAANELDYNPTIALILCLLLGSLGVHQFYMKNIGKGILYLFTLGLFGIGTLVDIVKLIVAVINGNKSK